MIINLQSLGGKTKLIFYPTVSDYCNQMIHMI